jgi:hypothetical protein
MTDELIDWEDARTPGHLAARMLAAIDRSNDRLAVFAIPILAFTPDLADETEDIVRREFNRAKQDRPHLAVQLVPAAHEAFACLLYVHEHEFVGGHCIRGCRHREPSF